jgi:hypothetical protein
MKYRKLRIAWSVVWGIVCLLLVLLWVRSFFYWDQLWNPISKKVGRVIIETASGSLVVGRSPGLGGGKQKWHSSRELGDAGPPGLTRDLTANLRHRDDGFAYFELGGFAYVANGWLTTIRAPLWSFAVLFATLSAVPWFRWSRRFSLHTLLMVMTAAAIGLGVVAYILRG